MGAGANKAECLPECVPLPLLDETHNVVELLDGRKLAFREYGDPSGVPVIFYHGSLSSRLFMPSWDDTHEAAVAAGARVIALDRPGYGRSSFHAGRTFMDNGAELRALLASAEDLEGRRVALLGHRSGGPNALAAAYVTSVPGMDCQVAVVGLASSEGPRLEMDLLSGGASGRLPPTAQDAAITAATAYKRLRAACEELWDTWPDRCRMLAADLSEATRQGCAAAEQDLLLEGSPWDFQLEDVNCRTLLWHGEDDKEVLPAVARHLASRLPDCSATFVKCETHLLVRRRWEELLLGLVQEVQRAEGQLPQQGPPPISVLVRPGCEDAAAP